MFNRRIRRGDFLPARNQNVIVEEAYPMHDPDWREGFAAVVMAEVLAHRGNGSQLVAQYCAAIGRQVERYRSKKLPTETMQAIEQMAQRAIDRAKKSGVTAYEAS